MNKKAQASLEYLALLAVFFGVIAIVFPAVLSYSKAMQAFIETQAINDFCMLLATEAEQAMLLGDGSVKVFSFHSSFPWQFNVSQNTITVVHDSTLFSKTLVIPVQASLLSTSFEMQGATHITLTNNQGTILMDIVP
jgi:uncharacterized protein (UPF0333 family)